MKRKIKSLFLALAVLISSIPVTMSAVANDTLPTYNAYNDFVNSSNPNGVWTYQYRADKSVDTTDASSYKNLVAQSNSTTWMEVPSTETGATVYLASCETDPFATGSTGGAFRMEPHTTDDEAVMTFTAPYSGTISLSMANGGVYVNGTGVYNFKVLHNGAEVNGTKITNLVRGSANYAGPTEITVQKGDTVRFVIGVATHVSGIVTMLNPQISYTAIDDSLVSYNAYNDFSTDKNPNLPWQYQYRVMEGGAYAYYDLAKDVREGKDNAWNTNDYAEIAKTQGDQVTSLTNDILCLAPWTNEHQAVLTFVAPHSGKINIYMTNGGIFTPYQSQDGVSFWLLQNENEIVSVKDLDSGYNTVGNRCFSGVETLTVEKGDLIRFVIGRNAALDGRTYLNPQINYTVIEESLPLYNAYTDFSTESNPNLPWRYQYRLLENEEYVYYDMTTSATSSASDENLKGQWSATDAAISKTQGDKVVSTTCDIIEMAPHSNSHQVVLGFEVPYSGEIEIAMTNGGIFAPYQSADGVSFWLLHNDHTIQYVSDLDNGYNTAGNRIFAEKETLTVSAGDTIQFVVGRNAYLDGRTYMNPEIKYVSVDDTDGIPIEAATLDDVKVEKGTTAEELPLPEKVNVMFSDSTTKEVGVTWDTSNYSSEIGEYVLVGTLDIVNNPKGITVEIIVKVQAKGAVFETYTIWAPGEVENVDAYHQFTLFTTSKGTLMATAEARDGFSDGGTHHIALKRSTDGGKTWGETIIIANGWNEFGDNVKHCFANGSLLEDRTTGKIFCFFSIMESGNNHMYYKTSIDDGLTWSSIVEITDLFKDDPYERERQQATPGQGIQIQNGPHKGRLILPTNCAHDNHTSYAHEVQQYGISVIYSDDGGDNWIQGFYSDASGLTEPAMVELADGTLVLNCRNAAVGTTSENYRYKMISTDGGSTWSKEEPWKSIGTFYGCHSDLYADVQDGYTRMLFSSIESGNSVRNNLQIRLSYDDGATWSFHKEIWRDETITGGNGDGNNDILNAGPGSSGITMISDGTYGVLHGTRMINTRVEIIVFNLAWLTDGQSDEQILKELKPLKNSFDAYDDFSNESNPNLPWKYQYRLMENGEYKYYDMTHIGENQWGVAGRMSIKKTQGDMVISSTCDILELVAHNTTDQAVLTFVAPYDGEIYIQMENHAIFAPLNSAQGASFMLLHNDTEIIPKTLLDSKNNRSASSDGTYTGRFFTGTETLTVKAGDIIRFVVGREAAVNAATYFNPDITYTRIDMPGANRDINGDRVITENDADEMRKVLVGSSEIDFYDVNEDTACDAKDLVSEKKYLSKIN